MATRDETPARFTAVQRLGMITCLVGFACVLLGTLIASVWFLPSPWHLLGAVPATVAIWALLRESFFETLIIFIILLFVLWLVRSPIQQVRQSPQTKPIVESAV